MMEVGKRRETLWHKRPGGARVKSNGFIQRKQTFLLLTLEAWSRVVVLSGSAGAIENVLRPITTVPPPPHQVSQRATVTA